MPDLPLHENNETTTSFAWLGMSTLSLASCRNALRDLRFWAGFLGWGGLLGILITSFLIRAATLNMIAAGIGLAGLLLTLWLDPRPVLPWRGLRVLLLLFFGLSLLQSLLPPVWNVPVASETVELGWGFTVPSLMFDNLAALRDTAIAALAASLALMRIRTRGALLAVILLAALVLLVISVWAPLDHWLRGHYTAHSFAGDGATLRLCGSKGNAARYSSIMYLGMFFPWMALLCPELRVARLPRWTVPAGLLVALLVPLQLTLRKTMPYHVEMAEIYQAPPWAFWALYAGVMFGGCALWLWLCRRATGVKVIALCAAAVALAYVNIGLTHTRLTIAVSSLMIGLLVLMHSRWGRWRWLLLGGACTLLVLTTLVNHKRFTKAESLGIRIYYWTVTAEFIRDNPWFGWGYGNHNFDHHYVNAWPRRSHHDPGYPEDARQWFRAKHAHNSWIEIIFERGVVGLLVFVGLWGSALAVLLRAPKHDSLRRVALVAALGVAGLLLHGALDHVLQGSTEMLYWIIAGVGLAVARA